MKEQDANPAPPLGSRNRDWLILIIGTLVLLLAFWWLVPSHEKASDPAEPGVCAGQLKLVGAALVQYAKRHDQLYPSSLIELVAEGDLSADLLVCSQSGDTSATGPTTQATVMTLSSPGHLSYVFIAGGKDYRKFHADKVLAYESLGHHRVPGMNILFGDGHVEFFKEEMAKKILTE